jgi:hypothetical protein
MIQVEAMREGYERQLVRLRLERSIAAEQAKDAADTELIFVQTVPDTPARSQLSNLTLRFSCSSPVCMLGRSPLAL